MNKSVNNVSEERLRLAERCLIGASSERPELLTDENWATAMKSVYEMLKSLPEKRKKK